MPEETKKRRGEITHAYKRRAAKAEAGAAETSRQKSEDAHKPWIARWEKETGKKHGISTHGEYLSWLDKIRKARAAKPQPKPSPSPSPAPSGVSASDAGDAMARDKEKKKD